MFSFVGHSLVLLFSLVGVLRFLCVLIYVMLASVVAVVVVIVVWLNALAFVFVVASTVRLP